MSGSRPIIYWDTCVILAFIQDEERPDGEMDGGTLKKVVPPKRGKKKTPDK